MILTACAQVKIKDAEFCGDMGSFGASCFHTLSDASRELGPMEWASERFGMICTRSENFTEWKKNILKLCEVTKRCSFEARQTIEKLAFEIEAIEVKLSGK